MAPAFESPLAASLLSALPQVVRRSWLEQRLTAAAATARAAPSPGARAVVVVGGPGSGKTVLAAQLALAWRCPYAILRVGSTDSALATDPKNVFVSLGLQLRSLFGPEIFGPATVEIRGRATTGKVLPGASAAGVRVGTIRVSPFQRVLIDAELDASEVYGEGIAADIGQLRDVVAELSASRLAQEAIVNPLRRLETLRPGEDVRIIVDGLDENPALTRALPLGPEGPENTTWVLMSRPGQHLDRLTPTFGSDVVRVGLDEADTYRLRLDDAERYVNARLASPDVEAALEREPLVTLPARELARVVATASDGNFLYLHHLLYRVEEEARAGRLPPALTRQAELPAGLDGIYRFLVSDRLRARAGAAWRDSYAPLLGILAVARAPLVTGQLADAAGIDLQTADEVLGEVEQFIERVRVPGDSAVALYHRSFGEFLVTQDRSRNPAPLEPAAVYHRRLASIFDERSDDNYALEHLPYHLAEAGEVERLSAAITGTFTRRQWEILGAPAAVSTWRFGVRAAGAAARDDLLAALLDHGQVLKHDMSDEWESGRYIVSLLYDHTVVGRRVATGGPALPWSAFLAAERLLDLDDPAGAVTLLKNAMQRPWPRHHPEQPRAFGLGEGTSWDWANLPLAHYLARVAEIEPQLALTLTSRLFVDGPNLPNVQTAWRDVLRAFLGRPASASAHRRIADVTADWLSKPRFELGLAGLSEALSVVIARAVPAALDDVTWITRMSMRAFEVRWSVSSDFAGFPYDNAAAALDGLQTVATASEGPAADALEDALRAVIDDLPVPAPPSTHSFGRRAEALGRFACVLYRAGAPSFKDAANAALVACQLDASSGDPPLGAVATALAWLGLTTDETRARAEHLAARYELVDRVAEAVSQIHEPGVRQSGDVSLDDARDAATTYEAARITLALWRKGTATRDTIAAALRDRRSVFRTRDEHDGMRLRDVTFEALIRLLVGAAAPWALDEIAELNSAIDDERRDADLDWDSVRTSRWKALTLQGCEDLLRGEVTASRTRAGRTDLNTLLSCCMAAARFDPDLADHWWADLSGELDAIDRGLSITLLVSQLASAHPERLDDLGLRWSNAVPVFAARDHVANFEPLLCRRWAPHAALERHVAQVLKRFSLSIDSEFERVSSDGGEDGWPYVGDLLRSAAAASEDQPEAHAAAADVAEAVRRLWQTRKDPATASRQALGILEGFSSAEDGRVLAGPAVGVAAELLDEVSAAGLTGSERVTALRAATSVKAAAPVVSRRVFGAMLAAIGTEEPRAPGMAGVLIDAIATGLRGAFAERAGGGFTTPAEEDAFSLVSALTSWCTEPPWEERDLVELQQHVRATEDLDRRSVMMAAIAAAWLGQGDLERARVIADAAAAHALDTAGYFSQLATLYKTIAEERVAVVRELTLESVARSLEVKTDTVQDILTAWFGLRARADSRKRPQRVWFDPDCLRRIINQVKTA